MSINYNNILKLPNFTLVSASAGSGKTTELTKRFIQFLLSKRIKNNALKNILAITFTNNAALEMKQRVLETLKKVSFGDKDEIEKLTKALQIDENELVSCSYEKIDYILDNYSDFQVQTIDSFLSRVIKASALEFGLSPSFEIILDIDTIIDEAFDILAFELTHDEKKRRIFEQIIHILNISQGSNSRFLWDPYEKLLKEVKNVYKQLSYHVGYPKSELNSSLIEKIKSEVLQKLNSIDKIVSESKFEYTSKYQNIVDLAKAGKFNDLIKRSLSQTTIIKSKDKSFPTVMERIEKIKSELVKLQSQYFLLKSYQYYQPFVETTKHLTDIINKVWRQRGELALGEATKVLASKILEMNLPEIYFTLGEQIYHFLIDEFQDTSPIQWATLRPLIEESLGKAGSLFLVGDTKQAIFTFRGGDWQIMARMDKEEEFPSVKCSRVNLGKNYRSSEAIVDFVKKVFHEIVPKHISKDIADLSGLASYEQEVNDKRKGKGYVEVKKLEKLEVESDLQLEKKTIIDIIHDCQSRGYKLGDIAILTPKNEHVIAVSEWLNAEGIKFLSYSSLDIRKRKITGEILSLLKFLDSPIDDLSFASFLLSDVLFWKLKNTIPTVDFRSFLFEWRKKSNQTLYVEFRNKYPTLWEENFEHLFNVVGYLPVYDLIAEIYKQFDLYNNYRDESATLVKLLEVINEFESKGYLSLKDFLETAEEESEDESWNISVPTSEEAVTIMTIHKAKGLGFPTVITLFYDEELKHNSMVVEEDDDGLSLVHVTKDESEYHEKLAQLYNRKENMQQVDELNKLYVALTRAEEEMYVISIKRKTESISKYLPENGFRLGSKTKEDERKNKNEQEMEAPLFFSKTTGFSTVEKERKIAVIEIIRGDFVHDILAQIVYIDGPIENQISEAIDKVGHKYSNKLNPHQLFPIVHKFISCEEIRELFIKRPDRKVFIEQEITDKNGTLFRIDRMIIDNDKIMVIDFKTGEQNDEYSNQIKKYIDVLSEKYAGFKIQGFLAYVDLVILKEVP